jgi:hypothetical protein
MSEYIYWAEARGIHIQQVLGLYRTEAEAKARCEHQITDTAYWRDDNYAHQFNGDGYHRYVVCRALCDGSAPEDRMCLQFEGEWRNPRKTSKYVWLEQDKGWG